VADAATYPTNVPTLHQMLDEHRALIESLKANLHRLLKWRFGPKSEVINIDQFALFADGSTVIEVPRRDSSGSEPATTPNSGAPVFLYSCKTCHGAIVRAAMPVLPPIPKIMASASLLAYLIVSKFADGLPFYRIAGRMARLGIELSHTLMSEWLVQWADLLEDLHRRITAKVLDCGHIYTDDTTLPLQNDDPTRRKTFEAKLCVYAKDNRHGPPLIVYEFSRSRSRDAPLTFLADYRGYLQADAYPGYDPLFIDGKITEVACNVHARRKFVEAADLLEKPGRPHEALAFYKKLFRIEHQIEDLSDEERLKVRLERTVPLLTQLKAWLDNAVHTAYCPRIRSASQ
jgi:hypothetical protein